ncbi:MAG: glycosyltransferase [Candidatus Hodarchaeota archaeon]
MLTYNSSKTIYRCLSSIKRLAYPQEYVDVIILDNGSTDDTLTIAKKMEFHYYSYPELNISQLRNKGVEHSRGEIVAFIDSDCLVHPDWLNHVVRWFDDPKVGIVGNEYLLPKNPSYLEKNWYQKSNYGIKKNDLIPAGNMAVSRKLFIKLGGFDPVLLTGEDSYLLEKFRNAGCKTISDHKIKCVHLGYPKNLVEYYKKEIWYGLGMLGSASLSKFDKPFIFTHLYLLLLVLLPVSVILYLFTPYRIFFVASNFFSISLLIVPFFSAVHKIYVKKQRGNLFYVMVIFMIFFIARVRSLLYIYKLQEFIRR